MSYRYVAPLMKMPPKTIFALSHLIPEYFIWNKLNNVNLHLEYGKIYNLRYNDPLLFKSIDIPLRGVLILDCCNHKMRNMRSVRKWCENDVMLGIKIWMVEKSLTKKYNPNNHFISWKLYIPHIIFMWICSNYTR